MHRFGDMCWGFGTEENPPSDGNQKITGTEVVTSKNLECEVTMPTTAFKLGVLNTHKGSASSNPSNVNHMDHKLGLPMLRELPAKSMYTSPRVAGIESDTWLTGYPCSQDPAPHTSVQ